MKMKYDNIVGAGCSFMDGSNILEEKNGKFVGYKFRAAKVLADKLGIPEINLANSGASNDRIFFNVYEHTLNNESSNNFYIIGTSGISRQMLYSNFTERFWDIHAYDFEDPDVNKKRSERLFGPETSYEFYEEWAEKNAKYLYNLEIEQKKLCHKILGLSSYLKERKINHIFFNALDDHIFEIKDKLNYLSFNIPTDYNNSFNKSDFKGDMTLEDCWYHYLRFRQTEETPDFNNYELRLPYPPYGKWFCGGHPSPNANDDFSNMIIEKHNELYPEYKI